MGLSLILYLIIIIAEKNIYDGKLELKREKLFLWLYRILVVNALVIYATRVTLATFQNLAILIQYFWLRK